MIVVEKNEGAKIPYTQNGTVVSFADGRLSLDCALYQKDWLRELLNGRLFVFVSVTVPTSVAPCASLSICRSIAIRDTAKC